MFERIEVRGIDQLMALMQQFRADPRPHKVDLVVGVYKDAEGRVPVMAAVKAAEARLLAGEDSKNYVGIAGDPDFTALVPPLLLGAGAAALSEGRVACVQTPGGSGALRVGCDLIARIRPGTRIWMSTPTWANHAPIAADAGLAVAHHPYFRPADRGLDFTAMMAHLDAGAQPGDALLLHACCHNPTGVDLGPADWTALAGFVRDRGLLPFVDCAYQGLGQGLDADAAGLRTMAAAVPEMLIASSFSKSFAIYRERCGALTAIAAGPREADLTMQALQTVIRSNYSTPPSHGARTVATVFADPALHRDWQVELATMRDRILTMRRALRDRLAERQVTQDLGFLTDQTGMFSYTGFGPDTVARLRAEFGVYTAGDGRINIAALGAGNLDAVADAFAAVMR